MGKKTEANIKWGVLLGVTFIVSLVVYIGGQSEKSGFFSSIKYESLVTLILSGVIYFNLILTIIHEEVLDKLEQICSLLEKLEKTNKKPI